MFHQAALHARHGSAAANYGDTDHSVTPISTSFPPRRILDPSSPLHSFAQRLVSSLSDSVDKLASVADSTLEKALAMKFARALDDVHIMELAAAEKKLDQAASYAGTISLGQSV